MPDDWEKKTEAEKREDLFFATKLATGQPLTEKERIEIKKWMDKGMERVKELENQPCKNCGHTRLSHTQKVKFKALSEIDEDDILNCKECSCDQFE